jgi:uncharacterized protein (DUF1015 family)
VPRLAPFRALRFDPAVAGPLDLLTAPPYDVISGPNRERLRGRSPYNIVHVDLADEAGEDVDEGYDRAAATLHAWRDQGALVLDDAPAYYAYELRFPWKDGRRTVRGVLGALELEPFGHRVLPHEQTMDGPIADRLRLLRASRTQLSPIYGLVAGRSTELADALDAVTRTPPVAAVRDEEGVDHRIWAMPADADVGTWLRDPAVLIADGHHRYATALAYRDERRRRDGPGPWDDVMFLVVDAGHETVPVLPYHRVQLAGEPPNGGIPRVGLGDVLADLDDAALRYGTVTRTDGMVVYRLHDLRGDPPTVRALHDQILDRVAPGDDLRFTHDARDAERAVRDGTATAAYLLPPTTPDRIRGVVERGERLPRKSTFFWPKPRTGIVMMPVG